MTVVFGVAPYFTMFRHVAAPLSQSGWPTTSNNENNNNNNNNNNNVNDNDNNNNNNNNQTCGAPSLPIWLADHVSVFDGSSVLTCGGRSSKETTLCW